MVRRGWTSEVDPARHLAEGMLVRMEATGLPRRLQGTSPGLRKLGHAVSQAVVGSRQGGEGVGARGQSSIAGKEGGRLMDR